MDSTKSQPINDGFYTKCFTVLLFKTLTQKHVSHWRKSSGRVVFVSRTLCIKSTASTRLAEAHAMRFVAQNTSVPVPRVYSAFEFKGRTYILMERLRGDDLCETWTSRPEGSKARILAQLADFVRELRSIPAPDGVGIASADGGPIYDQRLPERSLWGPFHTIHEFHSQLRSGIEAEHVNESHLARYPRSGELIAYHNRPWPTPVFTHGDLSSLNIIGRDDDVVGIVDWETAGWMPPYWEYTSAWHVNPSNMFWQAEVDKFITPLPYDLEMEKVRREAFGDF